MDVIECGLNFFDSSVMFGVGYVDGVDDGDGYLLVWSLVLLICMWYCSCYGMLGEGVGGSCEEVLVCVWIWLQGVVVLCLVECVCDWIECYIDDEDLLVDWFVFVLNMLCISLYCKLVVSIGYLLGELIWLVCLQLVYWLLCDGEGNVLEVVYVVGFVSLFGFSCVYCYYYGELFFSMCGGCCV